MPYLSSIVAPTSAAAPDRITFGELKAELARAFNPDDANTLALEGDSIVAALRKREIPAAVSQTAGTFVCNHVFYALMHGLRHQPRVRAGFIHVPFIPELARSGQPSVSQEKLNEAIAVAIEVTLSARKDRRESGGQTH